MDAGQPRGLDLDALLAKAEHAPEPYGSDIRDLVALVRSHSSDLLAAETKLNRLRHPL